MADQTRIDWCDATINPWGWGCYGTGGTAEHPKVCSYCYAKRLAKRQLRTCPDCRAFIPHWHPEELDKPRHWKRPRRIFVESMGDPFGSWVTTEQLDHVLDVIQSTPQHTYYMLTKRPENIMAKLYEVTEAWPCRELGGGDVIPNLWIGASVDTQARASQTLLPMLAVDDAGWNAFVSIEPMLTAIDYVDITWADWIIIGAQTGPGADKHRPERGWIRHIVGWALDYQVPVFLKSSITELWPDLDRREWPKEGTDG